MNHNYFVIDGSALLAQVRSLQKKAPQFKDRKLDPILFIKYFHSHLDELGADSYKRATFYFPKGEITIKEYLIVPNLKKAGAIRDLYFKHCGIKIKGSTEFNRFVINKVPNKWRDRFTKSEKGIDIEICCDTLRLVNTGSVERIFLFTNDDDFVPLCKTMKDFGVNVSLIHLSDLIKPNVSLLEETDSYDIIPEKNLETMFFPIPAPSTPTDVQENLTENI